MDFHAELAPDGDSAQVEVRMIARIVRERGVAIVASATFAASEPVPSLDDEALVEAFDAAAGRMISDFAVWTLTSLGAV